MSPVAYQVAAKEVSIPDLIALIARSLVDNPDCVSLEVTTEPESTTVRLRVGPEDVGKLIGKQGRTARSLRTILSAASMKQKHRFSLDIVEEDPTLKRPPSGVTRVQLIPGSHSDRR